MSEREDKVMPTEEVIDHTVTPVDLEANPELETEGVEVGNVIEIPMEEVPVEEVVLETPEVTE